jgi:putative transposase
MTVRIKSCCKRFKTLIPPTITLMVAGVYRNELNGKGYPVGRYKIRQLMKEAQVSVRYRKPYNVTTNSDHALPVFDNLLNRQFDVLQTNQVYVADITYIWTQEGWFYLAVV